MINVINSRIRNNEKASPRANNNTVDTTYVMFFLALELGNSLNLLQLDSFVMAITLLSVLVLPFWLNNEIGKFSDWLLFRSLISLAAFTFGVVFRESLGTFIPEVYGFLPMTLLIITSILSVYFQFYSFLKLKFVK
jgi:hypothetical protein